MSKTARILAISTFCFLFLVVVATTAQAGVTHIIVTQGTCSPPCGSTLYINYSLTCNDCDVRCDGTIVEVSAAQSDEFALVEAMVCAINAPHNPTFHAVNRSDSNTIPKDRRHRSVAFAAELRPHSVASWNWPHLSCPSQVPHTWRYER